MLGSSIGLGHRPFTAGRGVRFPYRVPLIDITARGLMYTANLVRIGARDTSKVFVVDSTHRVE